MIWQAADRRSGGIGRRASLRSWWPKGRRGSSPFFRTKNYGKPKQTQETAPAFTQNASDPPQGGGKGGRYIGANLVAKAHRQECLCHQERQKTRSSRRHYSSLARRASPYESGGPSATLGTQKARKPPHSIKTNRRQVSTEGRFRLHNFGIGVRMPAAESKDMPLDGGLRRSTSLPRAWACRFQFGNPGM
jgi:hypothetical protein